MLRQHELAGDRILPGRLRNPSTWAAAANGYIDFAEDWPDYFASVEGDRLEELIDAGEALRASLATLGDAQSGGGMPLFERVLSLYAERYSEFSDTLVSKSQAYHRDLFQDVVDHFPVELGAPHDGFVVVARAGGHALDVSIWEDAWQPTRYWISPREVSSCPDSPPTRFIFSYRHVNPRVDTVAVEAGVTLTWPRRDRIPNLFPLPFRVAAALGLGRGEACYRDLEFEGMGNVPVVLRHILQQPIGDSFSNVTHFRLRVVGSFAWEQGQMADSPPYPIFQQALFGTIPFPGAVVVGEQGRTAHVEAFAETFNANRLFLLAPGPIDPHVGSWLAIASAYYQSVSGPSTVAANRVNRRLQELRRSFSRAVLNDPDVQSLLMEISGLRALLRSLAELVLAESLESDRELLASLYGSDGLFDRRSIAHAIARDSTGLLLFGQMTARPQK